MLTGKRIVELSHEMVPGEEEYGLEIESSFVDEVYPNYGRRTDIHYILQTLRVSSHTGTHIEFPRHFDPDGLDAATFPLDRLIGPACVLDFRHKADDEAITLGDVQAYDGLIRTGDIVFVRTGRFVNHNTPLAHGRPYVAPEAVRWLVEEKDVAAIGVDATGIEVKGTDYHPDHTILLKEHGRALIEGVGDLGQLRQQRFVVLILPLKMRGLDSSPIRLLAIEDESYQVEEVAQP
jgi:arylformamidase